jgi:hypothetical protein
VVIDFEHHYIPVDLGRRLGMDSTKREAVRTREAWVHPQLFDMDAQIRDMDRAGIDIAVQSCILGWNTTLENCRYLNDCAARLQTDYPDRFIGLAHAPVLDGEDGLRELERAVCQLGLNGVTISSQVNGLSLDAKEFTPFYDLMKRRHGGKAAQDRQVDQSARKQEDRNVTYQRHHKGRSIRGHAKIIRGAGTAIRLDPEHGIGVRTPADDSKRCSGFAGRHSRFGLDQRRPPSSALYESREHQRVPVLN